MKRELPFGFEKILSENRESAVRAVNDDEGAFLSALYLSEGKIIEPSYLTAMTERGMAEEDKEGIYHVTEEGMAAVSLYPLLGRNDERNPYPESFFPSILAFAASSEIPSGQNHYSKSFSSDFFTSIFPAFSKDRIRDAAMLAVKRLIELSVIKEKASGLSISLPEAERFMSLSEYERLALVIFPECTHDRDKLGKAALFIYLVSRISGIRKEDTEGKLTQIAAIAGIASYDGELLYTMNIIEDDGNTVSGLQIPEKSSEITVSSDFTISYAGAMPGDIYLYAVPEKCSTASEWKITKQSAKAAFSMNLSDKDIIGKLREISSFDLPETIGQRLSAWYESYSSIRAERALLLYTDERNSRIIDALPTMQMHIVSKLSPNIFLMKAETEMHWRRALENAGFDMLGPTEGPEMITSPGPEITEIPSPVFKAPEISEEREIPFCNEKIKSLVDSSDTKLRKALILSGFITNEEQPTPYVEMINGLYYQEKLRAVHQGETKKVYLESVDGDVTIGRPERTEDPDIFLVCGKSIRISKVWKVAVLPASVKDWDEDPSDNDNR